MAYMDNTEGVTRESLKAHLDSKTGVTQKKQQAIINRQPGVISFFLKNIDSQDLKASTKTSKKQSVNTLKDFASETKTKLSFDTLDKKFYDKYKGWLDKKFSTNTTWKHTKELKALLREAEKEGIKVHPAYRIGIFKARQIALKHLYLNDDQVEAIRVVDLSHLPDGYERARRLFMVGALSGLRYSDFNTLSKKHLVKINGYDYIRKEQIKTGSVVVTPVGKTLKKILAPGIPSPLSSQKMNEYIKVVGGLAEIKKSKQITTHTARRSFASNAYADKVPMLEIMGASGHKKESSLLRYINVSAEEHAKRNSQVHERFLR